jgi:hypothetical protein
VAYNYDWEEFSDSYDTDYVEDLKQRLQTAELTLQRKKHSESGQPHLFAKAIRALVKPLSPPHPEDSASIDIADSFRALSIDSPFPDPGFQGKGSAAMLVKAAVAVRPRNENGESHARSHRNLSAPKPWTFKSVSPRLVRRSRV